MAQSDKWNITAQVDAHDYVNRYSADGKNIKLFSSRQECEHFMHTDEAFKKDIEAWMAAEADEHGGTVQVDFFCSNVHDADDDAHP